jgi:hypothetical protein
VLHAHKRDEVPAPARAKGAAGPGDEAPPSAAEAQAVGEAALLERRLALFSRAFLDAFDPIDHLADDKSEKVARPRPPRPAVGAAA